MRLELTKREVFLLKVALDVADSSERDFIACHTLYGEIMRGHKRTVKECERRIRGWAALRHKLCEAGVTAKGAADER